MSEPTGMNITIGGKLKHSLIYGFLAAMESDIYEINAGPYLEKDFPKSGEVKENTWYGTSNYGECDDLKRFCEEHNLAYKHFCEGTYDSTPSLVYWLPGMKNPESSFATTDGEATIEVSRIRPYLDMLITIMKDGVGSLPLFIESESGTIKDIVAKALKSKKPYAVLEKEFKRLLPPVVPKISDLYII